MYLHVLYDIICIMYVANYVVFYSHHLPKDSLTVAAKNRVDPPAPGSTRWCVVHIHPESANTLALEKRTTNWIKFLHRLAVKNDLLLGYSLRHSTSRPGD